MRPAKQIRIYFSVGRERKRCRLIVGKRVEVLGHDESGEEAWQVTAAGVPEPREVIERALRHVFNDLPPFEDRRLYPLNVMAKEQSIEIELGAWA